MKMTKILSVVLVFVMLFTVLVACGGKGDPVDGTTTGGSGDNTTTPPAGETTTAVITDENGYEVDDLPKDKKWDDEIYLFTWKDQLYWEFAATEETGDTVKDEVYRRKVRLEDTYGITLKIDSESGNWDTRASFIKTVEANQAEEGELAYDIVGCYFPISGDMTVKGFFDDLSNEELFPYLNLDKPWWPADLLGSARVNNSVYAATGDITPTFIRNMSMVHANLDLIEKYNAGTDIYKIVEDKEWTYEKLEELALGNSDAVGADREYGLTMGSNVIYDNMLYGAGFLLVDNLDDGSIALADLDTDERFLDFYEYAYKLLNENADVYILAIGAQADATKGTGAGFQAGNVMFNFGSAADVQNSLTNVDFNVGILPMPMYKTAVHTTQDNYYTVQGFWTTLYSVPQNSDDKEFASFVLEALASDAYRNLTPTWYDTMFKGRFLETPENAEMFDIIHDGILFDTARIFGTQIDNNGGKQLFGCFRQAANSSQWVSYYTANAGAWEEKINQINSSLGN